MLEFTTSVVSFSLELGHLVTLKFLNVKISGGYPETGNYAGRYRGKRRGRLFK
jgi:hypothetical protein